MAQLPEPSDQTIRILLVDDEVRLTELLRLELDVEGYDVEVASDGATGLIKARSQPEPDLIVLDWNLPEETKHRWNSTKGKEAETQTKGDQGIFLIQARIVRNPVTTRSDREQDDASECTKIHEEIGGHVEHHCGKAVFSAAHKADHHKAGLSNRAVSQHPLHRGLG